MIKMLILLIALSILEILMFYYIKKYSSTRDIYLLVTACVISIIIVYVLSMAFTHEKIGIVNAIWNGMSLIFIILLGYFAFNENINTREFIAILLIIIAIIMLV